jgi:hypothetical protein
MMAITISLANKRRTGRVFKGFSHSLKVCLSKKMTLKYFVGKCQSIKADRQQLWRVYDESTYAHSFPKCVWRRHGALLMYARYHNPAMEKPVKWQSTKADKR